MSAAFAPLGAGGATQDSARAAAPTGSHIGNLYDFAQQQADSSPVRFSFLRSEFGDLERWQVVARARVFDHLLYFPPVVWPEPKILRRKDRGDYVEEYLTFQTAPGVRVPAYVLIPKKARLPAPGIVALHCHGGYYLWGKEKVVELDEEHPALSRFKQELYEGKSIASELARQGYVVITIDMFYWGERRMLLDDDPPAYRERPRSMRSRSSCARACRYFVTCTGCQVMPRSSRPVYMRRVAILPPSRTAGITWPGVLLWDDIRTVDYLASRPEVDKTRLACVGLSVGGYRSFALAALDPRIKAAVDVGWMTSYPHQIKRHVINSIGFTFHIIGLYRYLDFPDLAALIAPRAVLVINGSKDQLFAPDGVRAAFEKIRRCYEKAGAPERQRCSLYPAPHEFNLKMQEEAWEWLKRWV